MKSQFKTFQICLLFMALTSQSLLGCGDLKKINEVRQATEAVKKGTDDTNAKLDKAEGSLGKIASNTAQLAESAKGNLRSQATTESALKGIESGVNTTNQQLGDLVEVTQKDAEKREKILNSQLRKEALLAVEKAGTVKERYSNAKKYILAFDFQSFKVKEIESRNGEYESRLGDAMKEFFVVLSRYAASDAEIDPSAKPSSYGSDEDRHSIFNALVLSLHEKTIEPTPAADQGAELKKTLSLFDVMVRALNQRTDIQRGVIKLEESPEYVREVVSHEERSFQVLQARHNLFAVRLASEFFQYEEMGVIKKVYTWFRSTVNVNLDESSFNLARLKKIETEILLPALENKRWLIRIGKRPDWTDKVRDLIRKMELSTTGKTNTELQTAKKRVIELYKDYIAETTSWN